MKNIVAYKFSPAFPRTDKAALVIWSRSRQQFDRGILGQVLIKAALLMRLSDEVIHSLSINHSGPIYYANFALFSLQSRKLSGNVC